MLTILGVCFVLSGLLDELQQWRSRPLYGGESGVAEEYGVLAPCHGEGEMDVLGPPWSCGYLPHTMDWLFSQQSTFFSQR